MEKLENFINYYWLSILLILCIPAIWALFIPGFYGASDEVHIAWLQQMDKTLKLGQIPPRFVPDLSFGYGYPLFNFVFPFPFYLGEIFHLLGMNFVDAIKFVFLVSVPLSAITMYFLLREFTTKGLSLVAAILFIYTPYRSTDLYVRGAFGEIVSFIFLPLICLSVIKLTMPEKKDLRFLGIGALALGLLVLTHNITTYMFFPFILLLGILRVVFLSEKKKILSNLVPFVLMTALGLLVSIYFWMPALIESKLMKYDTVFNFIDHFPTIRQLFTPYWGYGASVPGPYDGLSFFLGYLQVGLLLLGVPFTIYFWKKFNISQKVLLSWIYVSLAVVFFMMNFRSSIVWANLPLLPYFQFPWRFLIMTTFLIPLLVITLQYIKLKYLWLILLVAAVASTAYMFRPHDFLGRTDEYFLNKYVPKTTIETENLNGEITWFRRGSVDSLYLTQQEEYLRLPTYTASRPWQVDQLVQWGNGTGVNDFYWIKDVKAKNDFDISIKTSSNSENLLRINKYFFPGWVGEIDGRSLELKPGYPFGQIIASVPAGDHRIKVYFTETPFRQLFNIISLLSLITVILTIWKFRPSTKN